MTNPYTLDEINMMTQDEFVEAFADIAEDSPWVAKAASSRRPFETHEALTVAFTKAVIEARADLKLALLKAHPDLAGRAAVAGNIGMQSRSEQAMAGLDRLSQEEFDRFTELNRDYRARYGFPFILAVRGATKKDVLAGYEARNGKDIEAEFETAIEQVCRIMRFRLEDRVSGGRRR